MRKISRIGLIVPMQIVHFVHQIAKVIILVHPGLYQRVRHSTIKKIKKFIFKKVS